MSAFICSDNHISAIVRWATRNNVSIWYGNPSRSLRAGGDLSRSLRTGDEQELVDILYAENVKSVNYRYRGGDPTTGCVYDPTSPILAPVAVIKAVQSLEYQSCEHPGWETSDAKEILQAIQSEAIRRLPGYELAEWSI